MQVRNDTFSDPDLFNAFWGLYKSSFPEYEQRSYKSQKSLEKISEYSLLSFVDEKSYLGFLACWHLSGFYYIEHVSINPDFRGKGYGSIIFNYIKEKLEGKIVLEIDPVIDDISTKRFSFYSRLGFKENQFNFINPGYKDKATPHRLTLLSTPGILSEEEYLLFCNLLVNKVLIY